MENKLSEKINCNELVNLGVIASASVYNIYTCIYLSHWEDRSRLVVKNTGKVTLMAGVLLQTFGAGIWGLVQAYNWCSR